MSSPASKRLARWKTNASAGSAFYATAVQNSRALADKLANCSARDQLQFADLPDLHAPGCGHGSRVRCCGASRGGVACCRSTSYRPTEHVPDAELAQFDLLRFVNTQRQRLGRLNLPNFHAIAAVDMTFDVRDASWLFHLHLVTAEIDKQRLMRELKRFYLVTPQTHRPVVIKPVRDPVWQLSYRLKAISNRKEHYISAKGRPKEYPLKGPELRRLLLFLDRGSPTNLTFLFRAEFGANGNLRLKSLSLDQRGTQ